jgi:type III restriction enzyme
MGEEEAADTFAKEATVWVDGLDKIHRLRGINFCVDLSATPYYLGRVGQATNRIFPWTVSDFGLTDAIEAGLVKIPQLAVRDTTGAEVPGYFNVWRWIQGKLTPAERGGKSGGPKPEAILKWAHTPIVMLAGLWDQLRQEWDAHREDPRPPVFILVCKNTKIAKVIYDWLAEDQPPAGIPSAGIEGFRNRPGALVTIRVDSKVVEETDTGEAKNDESRWMRLTLDTVGRLDWPRDRQGKALTPEGFEELAKKLGRPLHPPGRDIRCIVSVGMLTEGWDCNTVTHIVGLRPFMSQLLCEQVVGRGLRRTSYDVGEDGKLTEEVAKIFGVPFEIIPFKANTGAPKKAEKRHHVYAVPQKAAYEIKFPRIEGYRQAIRNRITVNWERIATLKLDPLDIPPEVQMKAALPTNSGRPSLLGPGRLDTVTLNPYRQGHRFQELVFELAKDLTRQYAASAECLAPAHVLFPQLARIARRYLDDKVLVIPPFDIVDVFLSPYYGWVIERLLEAIRPDEAGGGDAAGETPEVPIYEANRGPGSTAEVNYWTSRDVREVLHSHLNYVVADTKQWEQAAAYIIDTHPGVRAFVKNAGLGFAIPYLHNGQLHDYLPDFILRLEAPGEQYLILETKGYDEDAVVKANAAARWVKAVNADGRYGKWQYAVAWKMEEVREKIEGGLRNV